MHTSLSGNKSDGFIQEKIIHKTFINQKGQIANKIKLSREHNWNENIDKYFNQLFELYGADSFLEKEDLRRILGAGINKSFIRIYVPEKSRLKKTLFIDKQDIEVTQKNGFTVFSFYFPDLSLGQKKEIEIYYIQDKKLNLKDETYYFCFEKSPGIIPILTKEIVLEKNLEIIKQKGTFRMERDIKSNECFQMLIN